MGFIKVLFTWMSSIFYLSEAAETIGKKGVKQREQKGYNKQRNIGITNAEASLEYDIV
jgi:hypothetical protein